MSRKKWVLSPYDKDVAAEIAEACGVGPLASVLLCARGLSDPFEAESFLYDTDLCDPYELPDMEPAVERVQRALDEGEPITVFGDYDCDGVTATALLYTCLKARGAKVDTYIPDRAGEGYGLNTAAIDTLHERGTKLIVTVDNGISAAEEVAYAKTLGIDTVVTDHHTCGDVLPDAVAVVNPHRADAICDFCDWAGVGVAFKLACALAGGDGYAVLDEVGDLVALGTVADVVPLRGENRILVRAATALLSDQLIGGTARPGVAALFRQSGSADVPDATILAFRLVPRLNAAGRMGSAERALRLLLTDDKAEAERLAAELCDANTERQRIEQEITAEAVAKIEADPALRADRVLIVAGEGWHRGVVGIVAARLAEKYGRPAVVLSLEGDVAKGSGRSIPGFSLYDALAACRDVFTLFGGHSQAAGMTLPVENIPEFRRRINEFARDLGPTEPELTLDCKLKPAALSFETVTVLSILEPYGAENPPPLFGLYGMRLCGLQSVGGGKHLRLSAERDGFTVGMIYFSVSADEFPYREGDMLDFAVRLYETEFRGEKQVSVQVRDVRPAGADDEAVLAAYRRYAAFSAGEGTDEPLVDRELCGAVYRYLKANDGWRGDGEILALRLGLGPDKIAGCLTALDVLTELGILRRDGDAYRLSPTAQKVDLDDSALYRRASRAQ